MPKMINTEKLNEYLSLGVQVGAGVKGTGYSTKTGTNTNVGRGVWTARIKFPRQNGIMRSTGIKYQPDNTQNKAEATRKAFEIFTGFSEKHAQGINIANINYVSKTAERYLDHIEESTQINEEAIKNNLEPRKMIQGGKSSWNNKKLQQAKAYWHNYLFDFVKQLPKSSPRDAEAIMEKLDPRDLDKMDEFLLIANPKLAIETRLKIITEFRHFLYYCYDNRLIDYIHQIKRPHRGGNKGARQRMRKEITPNMYKQMVDYTRSRYMEKSIPQKEADYAYIFHLWFLIMANCGIRVPTSGQESTMVCWEHLKKTNWKGKEQWTLKRPSEKGHDYEAIILEPAYTYWTALEQFYQSKGINTNKGFVFVHPHTEDNSYSEKRLAKDKTLGLEKGKTNYIQAGEPIKSFKKRWETMCKDLGYNASGTMDDRVPQSERVSPTSLRAWFITQRLYSGEDVKIELLARATGTSIGQIEARYLRLDMKRSYDFLSAGAYDSEGKEAIYDERGYYIGRK
jgi:integrase